MPPSQEDRALVEQLTTRNREAAERYLTDLQERLAAQSVRSEVRIVVAHRRARSIRALAERENADLVLVAAHGRTGDPGERYGGVTARLVQECPRPLMIVQDLTREVHERTAAEEAARGQPGH
jgi:nucleotide-binding universal stress UspA family protein